MYHFGGHPVANRVKTTFRYHGVVYHRNVQIGGGGGEVPIGGGGEEDGIPTSKLR